MQFLKNKISGVSIIPVVDSGIFKSLKDDYNKQIMILLSFFFIVGITIFYFMRKFIIKPMYDLLDFANHIKSNKSSYKQTMIQEYNTLAHGLENIISELRDVKEQYTLAVEGTQDGLWDWNIIENTIYFSSRCKEMIGFKDNELIIDINNWNERVKNSDKKHLDKALHSHLNKELDFFEDEFRVLCKDGTFKWLRVKAKALYDENGKAYRMLGFYSDIDKIKNNNINIYLNNLQ